MVTGSLVPRMNRRQYLASLGVASGFLAGCQGAAPDGRTRTGTAGSTASDSRSSASGTRAEPAGSSEVIGDVELPVPEDDLHRGAAKDAIPAITAPEFASDWSNLPEQSSAYDDTLPEMSLADDDRVIGVERAGSARAYPRRVLNLHEIVNDTFDGPLLVTFCPLCGSGMTAERRVDGEVTNFGVSGLLYQSDLVMYDEATESLWSQIRAQAIRGDRTGETLTLVPSTLTTWGAWQEEHPDTEVLLPPPISNTIVGRTSRAYTANPYEGYEDSGNVGIGFNEFDDDRLHPKTTVIGVASNEEARAYPLPAVSDADVVNDTVGDLPVVVTVDDSDTLYAYNRRVDGDTMEFQRADPTHLQAGGSRWNIRSGRAVDGPHEGTTLQQANSRSQMFWFAWLDFNPETTVYGEDS